MKKSVAFVDTADGLAACVLVRDIELVWGGDNIGLDPDKPADVHLRPLAGMRGTWVVPLATALDSAESIDTHGLQRMVATLQFAAAQGLLCEADVDVWRDAEERVIDLLRQRSIDQLPSEDGRQP